MNYKVQKQNLLNRLDKLSQFTENDENIINYINLFKEEIENELHFNVLCTGEFSAGKSTFINKFFIKKNILPTNPTETTAKLTFIKYGLDEKIVIYYLNKSSETINNISEGILKKYLAKNGDKVKNVDYVEIFINSEVLKEGVSIIDSPGLNAAENERVDLTNAFIPKADAVLYLMSAIQAWKGSEKDFLENKILNKDDLDKIFFLLNYWDVLEENEWQDVIDYVKSQLDKSINIVKRDLGEEISIPPVIPISAKTKYNFDNLEEELISYLSSKKGIDILNQKIEKFEVLKQKVLKLLDKKIELFNKDKNELQEELKKLQEELESLKAKMHQYKKSLSLKVSPIVDEWLLKIENLYKECEHNILKKLNKKEAKKIEDLNNMIKKIITNQTTYFQNKFNNINKRFYNKIQELADEEKAKFELGEYFIEQKSEDIYNLGKDIKAEKNTNIIENNISEFAALTSIGSALLLAGTSSMLAIATIPFFIGGVWYSFKKEKQTLQNQKDTIEEEIDDFIESKIMELKDTREEMIETIINNIKNEIVQTYEIKEKEYTHIIDKYETNEVEKINKLKQQIAQI